MDSVEPTNLQNHDQKRVLLDAVHSSNRALESTQPDPDLAARLREAAMRGRMNVSRGYSTTRSLNSPHSSPTKPPRSAEVFASDADTLKEVFASLTPGATPPVSPKKRDVAGRQRDDDQHLDSDDDSEEMAKLMELDEPLKANRPMKPLRTRKTVQPTPMTGTLSQPVIIPTDKEME